LVSENSASDQSEESDDGENDGGSDETSSFLWVSNQICKAIFS